MTRKAKVAAAPETTQEAPTALPPRDAQGYELDCWGLPIVGPVRIARLVAMGKPDPNDEPDAWVTDAGDAAGDEGVADYLASDELAELTGVSTQDAAAMMEDAND